MTASGTVSTPAAKEPLVSACGVGLRLMRANQVHSITDPQQGQDGVEGWADLSHNGSSVLAHKLIWEFEAGENLGEDLSLHHYLSHVHAVLGNLGQCTAHLPLQLGLLLQYQGSKVRHGTCTSPCLATCSCATSELLSFAGPTTLHSSISRCMWSS